MIIILLSACKKESSSQQTINVPPVSYIKSMTVNELSGTLLMQNTNYYDSLHRLIKVIEKWVQSGDTTLFEHSLTYTSSKVIYNTRVYGASFSYSKTIYNLNSSGLAETSIDIFYPNPADSTIEDTSNYQYNSDKYILNQKDSWNPGMIFYHYSNMNADYLSLNNSKLANKESFFYDNTHFNSLNNVNAGLQFLGKSCYNPMISAYSDSLAIVIANFSYTYDQENRIKQLTVNGPSVIPCTAGYTVPILNPHEIITYTYY
jgi:hypothetical protein